MCDNPNKDPWEVYIDPEILMRILPELYKKVLNKGVNELKSEFSSLKDIPQEKLVKFFRGVEQKKAAKEGELEKNIAHIEFDIDRIKMLKEEELRDLLGKKLVPRIIQDIKKLEINRPIPDWCYAFF